MVSGDFTNASEFSEQRQLKKEYKKPPVKFCGRCGSRAEYSAAWAYVRLYGPWFCLNDGHLDENLNPLEKE